MQSDFHNQNKSLLTRLGEALDQHRATNLTASYSASSGSHSSKERLRRFLPTPGNVIFTLLLIGGLLLAQNSGALTLFAAPNAQSTSTGTIAYQGRLADTSGVPLTDTYNMGFRLYSAATGGAPLWTEEWTGSNGVRVSDGLFNVMLGSLTSIPQTVITGNENLFLGITVGTDDEMAPRVQLGTVPFATQALTVPDGSITAKKLAGGVFKVYSTTQSTGQWNAPSCTENGGIHEIPGMTLDFTIDTPQTALIDVNGLGLNPEAGKAVYSMIYLNGSPLETEGGQSLLGGCRNSNTDSGNLMFCGLGTGTTIDLPVGTHKLETRLSCDGGGTVIIHNASMRALLLPQ